MQQFSSCFCHLFPDERPAHTDGDWEEVPKKVKKKAQPADKRGARGDGKQRRDSGKDVRGDRRLGGRGNANGQPRGNNGRANGPPRSNAPGGAPSRFPVGANAVNGVPDKTASGLVADKSTAPAPSPSVLQGVAQPKVEMTTSYEYSFSFLLSAKYCLFFYFYPHQT